MVTAETLPRHELAGLRVRVVDATDPTLVGVEGRVVDETTSTLLIAVDPGGDGAAGTDRSRESARTKQVPKAIATFEFALPAAPDADRDRSDDVEHVVVDGEVLVARPARRTERRSDTTWR